MTSAQCHWLPFNSALTNNFDSSSEWKKGQDMFPRTAIYMFRFILHFPWTNIVVHTYDVRVWFKNWDNCDGLLTLAMHSAHSTECHHSSDESIGQWRASSKHPIFFYSHIFCKLHIFLTNSMWKMRKWGSGETLILILERRGRVELRKHHWKKSPAPFGHCRFFCLSVWVCGVYTLARMV